MVDFGECLPDKIYHKSYAEAKEMHFYVCGEMKI